MKHESSLLHQIRTGHIGLKERLFKTGAAPTPLCSCGEAPETAEHIILFCPNLADERRTLRDKLAPAQLRTRVDLIAVAQRPTDSASLVRWVLGLNIVRGFERAQAEDKTLREARDLARSQERQVKARVAETARRLRRASGAREKQGQRPKNLYSLSLP